MKTHYRNNEVFLARAGSGLRPGQKVWKKIIPCGIVPALLVLILLLPPAMADDLTAQIITDPDQDVLPMEVGFSAQVEGGTPPYSYIWSFGDGGTSSNAEESHYYRESGQYQVSLAIIDSQREYAVNQKSITVSTMVTDYDNATFSYYTCTREISTLVSDVDNLNVMWVGTEGGLVRINFETQEKRFYTQGLPSVDIQALILARDGTVWVGTKYGLAVFNPSTNTWKTITTSDGLPENNIKTLIQTANGELWIGTNNSGIARTNLSLTQWSFYNTLNELPDNQIRAMTQTSDGSIWVGTKVGGVCRLDPNSDQWSIYDTSVGLPGNKILTMLSERSGILWVATDGGLVRMMPDWETWDSYTGLSGEPPFQVRALGQTADGTIWAISSYYGIYRLIEGIFPGSFIYYENSLPSNINALLETNYGVLWAGSNSGLYWINKDTGDGNAYDISGDLPSNCVRSSIQTSDGAIWAATSQGLVRLDSNTKEWIEYGTGASALLQAKDQSIWVGRSGSIAHYNSQMDLWDTYSFDIEPPNSAYSIIQTSDDNILIGTYGGILQFDTDSQEFKLKYDKNSGLPNNAVYRLMEAHDGSLWAGTWGGGGARIEPQNGEWAVLNTSTGFPDDWIGSLYQTVDETIWIGTVNEGLIHLSQDLNTFDIYNIENGLPHNFVRSMLQTDDGSIFIGTCGGGIAVLDPTTNQWETICRDNGLPDDAIMSLMPTIEGGLLVGTNEGGLVRLGFPSSSKSPGKLVLVGGGGAASTNTLWSATQEISESVYRIFHARGFKNTDIYFMSPDKWCDFNGDGFDDHIVDCPAPNEDRDPAVSDVEYAITDWAATNYTEDTPLFVYLIDHGYSDDGVNGPYFQVAPGENLYASQLDAMLDAYEAATGGQVVVINESCYSGEFLSYLKKEGRVIISSTDSSLAHYSAQGENCFSQYFLKNLYNNSSLDQAFSRAVSQLKISEITEDQTPQMDDDADGVSDASDGLLASTIKLGGDFTLGAPWPEILSVEQGAIISGSMVFTTTVSARMQRVWATVQPPGYEVDETGDYGKVDLPFFNLSDPEGDLTYAASYDDFTQTGVYTVTIFAKDQFGNVAGADPLSIPVGLAGKGTVSGNVITILEDYDNISVSAASGAITVSIQGTDYSAKVDSEGDFIIYGVTPGSYTLTFSGLGFDSVSVAGVVVEADGTLTIPDVEVPLSSTVEAVPCDLDGDNKRGLSDAIEIIRELSGTP